MLGARRSSNSPAGLLILIGGIAAGFALSVLVSGCGKKQIENRAAQTSLNEPPILPDEPAIPTPETQVDQHRDSRDDLKSLLAELGAKISETVNAQASKTQISDLVLDDLMSWLEQISESASTEGHPSCKSETSATGTVIDCPNLAEDRQGYRYLLNPLTVKRAREGTTASVHLVIQKLPSFEPILSASLELRPGLKAEISVDLSK